MVDEAEVKDEVEDNETKPVENYLGTWKTREEAEKGFNELQDLYGRQTNELGTLRGQVGDLTNSLTQFMQQSQGPKQPATEEGPSTEDELAKVFNEYSKLDFLNDEDAARKGAELLKNAVMVTAKTVKDETLKAAGSQFKEVLSQRDAESIKDDFLKSNPRFVELQKSGVFRDLKAQNPLHDDFSAYYETLASEAATKVSELEVALQEAKKAANLAGGDTQTSRVFTKPGSSARTPGEQPKTEKDRIESARRAVLQSISEENTT